ncbi:MAG TPA: Mu-like prophage major head subunit gpT family protein [Ktedonobacterales bacterium]
MAGRGGGARAAGGREVEVVALRSGVSKNGYGYRPEVVRELAPLLEGARAFADHPGPNDRPERSVRDLVGYYRNARVEENTGGQAPMTRVVATLHVLESAGWLWSLVQEALAQGVPDLVGVSIDAEALVQEAGAVKEVTRFVSLYSCDVVTRPSAGGAILGIRRASGRQSEASKGGWQMMGKQVRMLESAGRRRGRGRRERIREEGGWYPSEQGGGSEHALLQAGNDEGVGEEQEQQTAGGDVKVLRAEARRSLEAARRAQRMAECELLLGRRLSESHLPEPVLEKLRRRFGRRVFEAGELEQAVNEEREVLAALTNLGLIREMGQEKAQASGMVTEAEKVQAAFDRMLGLEVDGRFAGVRPFVSVREAYARVTGDPAVRGGMSAASTLGHVRVDAFAPIARISEADITTASFSYLLGTSMNKRLLHDYQAWPAEWKLFCSEVPIKDFKQQERVRLGAFGSLPVVNEDTAYATVTLTDAQATYSASKRGNIVTITRETIINDDLHAIRQIPTKLAAAAAYTLAEFVYSFLSGNGTIYDSNPLFDAVNHKNFGNTALATDAVQAGVTAMREQTNFAGKRLGLRPRYLVVPPELEFTGLVIVKSAGLPGTNNNDVNPMMGYTQLIVSPQLPAAGTPSSSVWYLAAAPAEVDTIEIGYVGGQVNPAMFIQDNPLYGLNFSQDAVSYKVRHEYGGAVMDWRGLYRGI